MRICYCDELKSKPSPSFQNAVDSFTRSFAEFEKIFIDMVDNNKLDDEYYDKFDDLHSKMLERIEYWGVDQEKLDKIRRLIE